MGRLDSLPSRGPLCPCAARPQRRPGHAGLRLGIGGGISAGAPICAAECALHGHGRVPRGPLRSTVHAYDSTEYTCTVHDYRPERSAEGALLPAFLAHGE